MKRNCSEAVVRRVSAPWRLGGAMFAAVAMILGVAPAFAADVSTLDLSIAQSPAPATYAGSATYTVTLKNLSNKTVNNAGITVTAPAGTASFDAPSPSCALSTGVACAAPVRNGPTFKAAGYQLPANGTLTITVGYYMPAAASPAATLVLNVAGTSSNNSTGPNSAAYTTVTTSYATVFAPPPPVYPQIQLLVTHDSSNTVLWSTPSCASAPSNPDCGASYYGQYTVSVKNAGSVAIPTNQPFVVDVSSLAGTFAGSFGCAAPCQQDATISTRVKITGLDATPSAGDSVSFTVLFKSPQQSLTTPNLDVTATATVGPLFTPAIAALSPAPTHTETTPLTDAAVQTYSSLVPATGGSAKAKNALGSTGNGPFSSRVDVPGYMVTDFPKPIDILLNVMPGTTSCSSSSPRCLDTDVDVQSNGVAVTFGDVNAPLDGSQLVITMVRDWTTLAKKPSSVFNATVWYTDLAGNRTVVKDCGSVDLRLAERCVAQRIDATTSAKGVLTGGYVKFIIWARHNGRIGW